MVPHRRDGETVYSDKSRFLEFWHDLLAINSIAVVVLANAVVIYVLATLK
jgi:hypothetical protein